MLGMTSMLQDNVSTLRLRVTVCLSLALLAACREDQSIYLSAQINQQRADYIQSLDAKNIKMSIRSSGGDESVTSQLGIYLLSKNLSLDVHGYCYSECAEFLLPAADSLNFIDMPMIGFNWSPNLDYHQLIKAKSNISACLLDSLANQKQLQKTRNLNVNFWKETKIRLVITKYLSLDINDKCPLILRESENHLWLPTSRQLRELWGLKFEGSVCADNFNKCTIKVDQFWSKGTRIAIGDEVYISKGRK